MAFPGRRPRPSGCRPLRSPSGPVERSSPGVCPSVPDIPTPSAIGLLPSTPPVIATVSTLAGSASAGARQRPKAERFRPSSLRAPVPEPFQASAVPSPVVASSVLPVTGATSMVPFTSTVSTPSVPPLAGVSTSSPAKVLLSAQPFRLAS